MGSGFWFKSIISKKKAKGDRQHKLQKNSVPENTESCEKEICVEIVCPVKDNAPNATNSFGHSIEDNAATRIQTAYRAYTARKSFHRIRRMVSMQNLVQHDSTKKQALATLSHLHAWTRIQVQIRARRAHMVTEGRLRQKKLENQLKLESKLHDFEVEWSGGSETASEALARIHQREEAAVRRERAMAYALSHQWRANFSPSFESADDELSKADWGWSWMGHWIAARPWESRLAAHGNPKKVQCRLPNKAAKNMISPTIKTPDKVKLTSPSGKSAMKARKLSYEGAAAKMPARKVNAVAEEKKGSKGKEES